MKLSWHAVSGKEYRLPKHEAFKNLFHSLSPFERVAFGVLLVLFVGSALAILGHANRAIMVEVPASGGTLAEGIVGTPRFINPLLAISDADKDLSSLVYSGLMRIDGAGHIIPDLAESYSISDDGLTYTVVIRKDAKFQDGQPVTADDVVYTVTLADDPAIKSPLRANWDGVTVAKVDTNRVTFTLKQAYEPFLENLTLGILPEHLWKSVDENEFPFSELNIRPIGSGPYKVSDVSQNGAGIPTSYALTPFRGSTSGSPFIASMVFRFYADEAALIHAYNTGAVDSIGGISPDNLPTITRKDGIITKSPLPRVFGIFFNQNQNAIFADANVRAALDIAVDKQKIVNQVLGGYGTPIDSPFPPGTLSGIALPINPAGSKDAALALLAKSGWSYSTTTGKLTKGTGAKATQMAFSIDAPDTPELKQAAESAANDFTNLGIDVSVKVFEPGDLSQNVIRPRDYEALFFGEVVGREYDLFAFWDSSQRIDPGLNIALYANISGDKMLENARAATNTADRDDYYRQFDQLFRTETPAVLIYAPEYVYIIPKSLQGRVDSTITAPSDRFNGIASWYIDTEWIWPIFENIPLRKFLP
jgi:peptide/nickel transport system substrate-binding protein